jgi:DNA gyrase subunit A
MRINEVPASSGYGEPVAKFFRLGDQVRIVNAVTTDERFTPADGRAGGVNPRSNGEPPEPYLLVVTAQGQTLRTPLAPFRTESNKLGRKYAKLNEGDKVVLATVLQGDEKTVYLASANGHVIHFKVNEINILAGVGKGVMGIKLEEGDTCLGGALLSGRSDKLVVETSGGKTLEFGRDKYEVTSRAGKGFEAVKRSTFVRVLPPPIELVDWDEIEGKPNGNGKGPTKNGGQRTLFEE